MSNIKAVRHVSFLWIGSLAGAGCAFLTQVILARTLSPQSFGVFASVLSLMGLMVPLVSFGVAQYWLKEFGQYGWRAVCFVKPSLKLIVFNMLLVMAILIVWIIFGPHEEVMQTILLIMSLFVLGQVGIELLSSKFQLEERYEMLALWQFSPHLIRFFLVFIVSSWVGNEFDVKLAAIIFACVSVFVVAICVTPLLAMAEGAFLLKGHGLGKFKEVSLKHPAVSSIMKGSWPFGLASVFHLVYFQSDIILIKYITGDEAAAYYNVAFTVMVAVLLFPSIVYQKFLLPKIHRWANHDRALFYKVYRKGNYIMLFLGLLSMFFVWLLAPDVVPFLFGKSYSEAVGLLMVLALSAPLLFVASSVGATLVTQEHMKLKVKLMGGVAIINVILNFIFIPLYGAQGAAFTTVISNFILLLLYYRSAAKFVFRVN